MSRYRLTIEYDGRPFMGWQRQNHGPSVQGAIEDAIEQIIGERCTLHAAGRTDAGVHALAMVAHVDTNSGLPPFRLMEALNARLRPQPIGILDASIAPGFHARFDCIRRRYRYHIVNRRTDLTWQHGLAWRVTVPLDAEAMHDAARLLTGCHDFSTFRSTKCQSLSPIKTLDRLDVIRTGSDIHIHAEARSFLHHQVRSMVGCLKFIGTGQWTAADLETALLARNRAALALNAPPDGLWFVGADY
ncbi:tRNA pseudouridine(38-40) synthase TruA [Polymorphobacter sp.]|uniref:tRNA pseudouridine(38-40) synthase TruA n=1 Tax=Polymorphobacter sp. TaxID=1909290 RepID=UPI003F6EDA79